MYVFRYLFLATLLGVVSVPAIAAEQDEVDPWEGFNRAMFSFNDTLDRYALKPAAQGYKAIMPNILEAGVSNFFGNLSDVGSMLNNLLQLKGNAAGQDLGRVKLVGEIPSAARLPKGCVFQPTAGFLNLLLPRRINL